MDEARPWIQTFETGAHALQCLARLAAEDKPRSEWGRALKPYLSEMRETRWRVFGDVLDMTLDDLVGE